MADTTAISWCDSTFNAWIGCTKISPGCDHCYAEVSAPAQVHKVAWGPHAERRRTSPSNWANPLRWERQHAEFEAEHGRRRRVFCSSLSDVFDNQVPHNWREDLWYLIHATPHLDWLIITKRISIVPAWAALYGWPANAWLGISIVNQAEANRDVPKLLEIPAPVKFVSMEPLLGPVDLTNLELTNGEVWDALDKVQAQEVLDQGGCGGTIDWVIVGGESGPHARPMASDWARSLRDQCKATGTPFFFKQHGGPDRDKGGCRLDDVETKEWPCLTIK